MERKWFWCERWRQMIAEETCLNRYRKGLKKCAGCERGHLLLVARSSSQESAIVLPWPREREKR
jgi:hypothetical protein